MEKAMTETDWDNGCVHVYTGDGKGKTTAALGLALRAAGAGFNVFIAQFIKGCRYSEIDALGRYEDRITLRQFGRGCFISGRPAEKDIEAARRGLDEACQVMAEGTHQVVILDEVNVAVQLNLLSVETLLLFLDARPPQVELILTGRGAASEVIERADLVTEMQEVKHYYREGIEARLGIEK